MRKLTRASLIMLIVLASCGRPSTEALMSNLPSTESIHLESSAFEEGGSIPKRYTCDGDNLSPPLAWSRIPPAVRSLALIVEDPDAPLGTFTHWVLYAISPEVHALAAGVASLDRVELQPGQSALQGKNDFGRPGYGGPCPPSGTHRYFFRLFALDRELALQPGSDVSALLKAMKGHVLATGELMGKYRRS